MSLKVTGDVISEMYNCIMQSRIVTDVTSNVFTKRRPLNFEGECIVINSLPLTYTQVQEGVINVNYIVPNLVIGNDPVDRSRPDSIRLDAGEKVLAEVLKDVWDMNGFTFYILQSTQFANDEANEWYVNCRVQYRNGI